MADERQPPGKFPERPAQAAADVDPVLRRDLHEIYFFKVMSAKRAQKGPPQTKSSSLNGMFAGTHRFTPEWLLITRVCQAAVLPHLPF